MELEGIETGGLAFWLDKKVAFYLDLFRLGNLEIQHSLVDARKTFYAILLVYIIVQLLSSIAHWGNSASPKNATP